MSPASKGCSIDSAPACGQRDPSSNPICSIYVTFITYPNCYKLMIFLKNFPCSTEFCEFRELKCKIFNLGNFRTETGQEVASLEWAGIRQ